jgi:hypothetical protein
MPKKNRLIKNPYAKYPNSNGMYGIPWFWGYGNWWTNNNLTNNHENTFDTDTSADGISSFDGGFDGGGFGGDCGGCGE